MSLQSKQASKPIASLSRRPSHVMRSGSTSHTGAAASRLLINATLQDQDKDEDEFSLAGDNGNHATSYCAEHENSYMDAKYLPS